jgi:hypothetical protein
VDLVKCVVDQEREPLRDEHGQPWLTCGPCAGRTRRALAELPALVTQAEVEARVPLKAGAGGPKVGGSTEPRSPLGLDAADLAGPARAGSLTVVDRTAWPEDQIGHLPVATEIEFWARDLAEVRGEGVPLPNVADLCGWLLDRLDDACRNWPPIDEMAPKIWAVHGALMGTLGLVDVPEYKKGVPCPKCGELNLYRANGNTYVECGSCPAYISEDEYREATVEAAADLPRSTVDEYQRAEPAATVSIDGGPAVPCDWRMHGEAYGFADWSIGTIGHPADAKGNPVEVGQPCRVRLTNLLGTFEGGGIVATISSSTVGTTARLQCHGDMRAVAAEVRSGAA